MSRRRRLAQVLRQGRIQARMTQVELAAAVDMMERSVIAWELGRTIPTDGTLRQLAGVLHLPLRELLELARAERWARRERRERRPEPDGAPA